MTAEAVVKLFVLADGEGGGFFVVEWAAGAVVAARLFERHGGVDQIHDIDACEKLVDELLRNFSSHRVIVYLEGFVSAAV